jgi:hypothetical protein
VKPFSEKLKAFLFQPVKGLLHVFFKKNFSDACESCRECIDGQDRLVQSRAKTVQHRGGQEILEQMEGGVLLLGR